MIKFSILFIFTILFFVHCKNVVPTINLASTQDPDIVLINIEDGDRTFIGKLLLKLDSLNPALIGIDAVFPDQKTNKEDSTLTYALKKINNDFLPYLLNNDQTTKRSDPTFTQFVKGQGLLKFERTLGLISNMTPRLKIGKEIHESFAYKIVKCWKPNFKSKIEINKQIPINYQRPLEKFLRLDGSFLLETNVDDFELKNKIFLVGYIGPGKENKYSSPLRLVGKQLEHNEPDTYGTVIIANQIRTILDYNK